MKEINDWENHKELECECSCGSIIKVFKDCENKNHIEINIHTHFVKSVKNQWMHTILIDKKNLKELLK